LDLLPLEQPDPDVLRRAQKGDQQAFTVLVRAYELPVHNYILRLTGDRTMAEDLTQEVFVRVLNGLPKFSLRCKFTTWLFQVTKNRVLDELRARERRPQGVQTLDEMRAIECYDPPVERTETIEAIWRAVQELNPDLKMALLLRDVVGLPYNEIADALEITLSTVKWRIFKAREEVQVTLAREGITFGGDVEPEPADEILA
jgi:RNA polymerase sigma-70 factor (ECF subfamily)